MILKHTALKGKETLLKLCVEKKKIRQYITASKFLQMESQKQKIKVKQKTKINKEACWEADKNKKEVQWDKNIKVNRRKIVKIH